MYSKALKIDVLYLFGQNKTEEAKQQKSLPPVRARKRKNTIGPTGVG